MGDLQVFLHHEDVDLETFVWGRYKDQGLGWHSSNATVYGFNGKSFNVRTVPTFFDLLPNFSYNSPLTLVSYFPIGNSSLKKLSYLFL